MVKRIWITWEIQRRNRTTSKELGATLFEFDYMLSRWLKYPMVIIKTLKVFWLEKPKLIFVQNPSMVLSMLAVCYGHVMNIPVVVDAHNAGVNPFENRRRWANWLARTIMRLAPLTLVTNANLAEYVNAQGGHPFVLPDPLPELRLPSSQMDLKGTFTVLFVCTWADDEPYLEVLQAADQLGSSVYIYITGNSKGKERRFGKPIPDNIVLTGYLDEQNYVEILFSVDVIMDLTTRDDCLVCGAYEAVAVEKPLVLSNTRSIRAYFDKGAVYTDNSVNDIARKIRDALYRRGQLVTEVQTLKLELADRWATKHHDLEALLEELAPSA